MAVVPRSASETRSPQSQHVGKRITQERLLEEAGHHNSVLNDVARLLSVSRRTLQRSVAFHRAYSKPPTDGLSWMHYQILSALNEKTERTFYQKQAADEGWSARKLQDAIRADLFHGGQLQQHTLTRPTSLAYCYVARVLHIVDTDTFDLDVDLGFSTWTKRRTRLAGLDAPDITTKRGRAARNFVATELTRAKTIVIKSQKSDLYGRYLERRPVRPVGATQGKLERQSCSKRKLSGRKTPPRRGLGAFFRSSLRQTDQRPSACLPRD